MANNLAGYQIEDMADAAQAPDSNLSVHPEATYLPIGRVLPGLAAERVSVRALLEYFHRELPSSAALLAETNARLQLQGRFEQFRRTADSHIEQNTRNIGVLTAQVAALARGGGGASPTATPGRITYGLRTADGVSVGEDSVFNYPDLPSTVRLKFSEGESAGDRWVFIIPSGVRVQHIWNSGFGERIDEIGSWTYSASDRQYTSPPVSVGFPGNYEVAIVAVGG